MKEQKGFTLLISVVVTSMLLIISFAVVNVAVKQLILSNSNEESQYAFYNADSGIECALFWDFNGGESAFDPAAASPNTITCNNQNFTVGGVPGNATSTFRLNLTTGCADVSVGKHSHNITIIDSRGYNTCSGTSLRRLERGQKLTYESSSGPSGGGGGGGSSGILGYNVIGGTVDSGDRNYNLASRYTMPAGISGTASSISVHIPIIDPNPANRSYQVAIYSDSSGSPGTKLAESAIGTLVAGWNTIPISAPLSANTSYWLAYNNNASADNFNNFTYDSSVPPASYVWRSQTFGTMPNPYGAPEGNTPLNMSIYVTYSIP